MTYRVFISALIVGIVAAGNNLQTILQTSSAPTKWQIISIVTGGVVLALNDIKSRITPPETPANVTVKEVIGTVLTSHDKP